MFAVTAGFHRYFAHRTYKTSRAFQLVLALLGMSAAQQGPLWWAAHHRRHHKHSDQPDDVHSPRQRGFLWSHLGWILATRHTRTDLARVKDLARYPELRFMNRYDTAFVVGFSVLLYLIGGATALVWGGFVPLVLCWHATFFINSRNNALLAVMTFGEGWHNNHHHYQRSARQGFYWWELDVSYYVLKVLERLRLVWDVEGVPRHVRDRAPGPPRAGLEVRDRLALSIADEARAPIASTVRTRRGRVRVNRSALSAELALCRLSRALQALGTEPAGARAYQRATTETRRLEREQHRPEPTRFLLDDHVAHGTP